LDLLARENIVLVRRAYESFRKVRERADLPMPQNRSPSHSRDPDLVLRFLDCAVMNHLHTIVENPPQDAGLKGYPRLEPFDTVRSLFGEGTPLYKGSGFREKTHTQIAVRNRTCIKGLFFLPRATRASRPKN
jgi:hypothetical protein